MCSHKFVGAKRLTAQLWNTNMQAGRYYDDSGTGLHIYVRKSGSKSWSQKIRFGGKQRYVLAVNNLN